MSLRPAYSGQLQAVGIRDCNNPDKYMCPTDGPPPECRPSARRWRPLPAAPRSAHGRPTPGKASGVTRRYPIRTETTRLEENSRVVFSFVVVHAATRSEQVSIPPLWITVANATLARWLRGSRAGGVALARGGGGVECVGHGVLRAMSQPAVSAWRGQVKAAVALGRTQGPGYVPANKRHGCNYPQIFRFRGSIRFVLRAHTPQG
jgi:hypothetical protein